MKRIQFFAGILTIGAVIIAWNLGTAGTFRDSSKGWFAAGSKPGSYDMGVTSLEHRSGGKCAFIKSKDAKIDGFGTYMQMSSADGYLGKSVRMTAYAMSKNVVNWAGMWMRVDGQSSKNSLAFDNMQDRPIKGTTDWKKYEIVLDVPDGAKDLAFGVLLDGTGEVYFDDVNFEVLGPATGNTGPATKLSPPTNLNFEN